MRLMLPRHVCSTFAECQCPKEAETKIMLFAIITITAAAISGTNLSNTLPRSERLVQHPVDQDSLLRFPLDL